MMSSLSSPASYRWGLVIEGNSRRVDLVKSLTRTQRVLCAVLIEFTELKADRDTCLLGFASARTSKLCLLWQVDNGLGLVI